MHNYTNIIDNICKISNSVLCVQIVNLFGEPIHYRFRENAFNKTEIKDFLTSQFKHIVDNSIYLNFEQFIFTVFNHDGFKTMVINVGEYSLVIALQKKIHITEFQSLVNYIVGDLLKDV